jgi:hypothetical protein
MPGRFLRPGRADKGAAGGAVADPRGHTLGVGSLVELLVLLPGGAADGSEGDGDEQAQDEPRRYDREHHHGPSMDGKNG